MRALVLLLGALLFSCAAEVADEDVDLDVQTDAVLLNGCYGNVAIQPTTAPGLSVLPWYNGTLWSHTYAVGNECRYEAPTYEYLYGPTASTCAQVDARTWYCGGFGVVTCPTSIGLKRPHLTSDYPFGPTAPFSRTHDSRHAEVSLPFVSSQFTASRVECSYNMYGKTYRYIRSSF